MDQWHLRKAAVPYQDSMFAAHMLRYGIRILCLIVRSIEINGYKGCVAQTDGRHECNKAGTTSDRVLASGRAFETDARRTA